MSSFVSSSGLSRVELLVLVAVLAVLGLVGAGPLLSYLEKSRINRAVENAATISTLLAQYATDNDGVYPVGEGTPAAGKSEGIARNLLANNYTPDAGIFALRGTEKYSGKEGDFSDFTAANIGWDFTAGANATTGITTAAPDLLPVVYSTGETVEYPTQAGVGASPALSGRGAFGSKGIVVAYKNLSAKFVAVIGLNNAPPVAAGFISREFSGTGTYTQIRP